MKILILSPFVPNPAHGGSLIRVRKQLEYFASRHEVSLAVPVSSVRQRERAEALATSCHRVYTATMPDAPHGSMQPFAHEPMQALVRELAAQAWDAVLLHNIFLAPLAEYFQAPVVLDEHNIHSELYRSHALLASNLAARAVWRSQALQLQRFEESWWPRFALRTTVSEADRERLEARCPGARVLVVPNGADSSASLRPIRAGARRILFCGLLSYRPNQDAAETLIKEIMPLVWSRSPETECLLAGAQAPAELRALAETDSRLSLVADPDDMLPLVDSSSALAVPLRLGSGSRIKILEAFAWGLPVVSTPVGCEGLEIQDGQHLLIRSEPAEFAEALLNLQTEKSLWSCLRREGRELVQARHDWASNWARLENALQELVAKGTVECGVS